MNCVRCHAPGGICRATVASLEVTVYVCSQCHALWTHPDAISPITFIDLDLFLQTHGITGGWSALDEVDSTWARTSPKTEPGFAAQVHSEGAHRGDDPAEHTAFALPQHQRLHIVNAGDDESDWQTEPPRVTLNDVAGMDTVKRRLHIAFLGPMQSPELRRRYGKSLRGGLLLFGPPGCGKTFVARAAAGELGARFVTVGLADILDMWFGESERKLHEIFEAARRTAPTLLFFDELDALGQKRSQIRNSPARAVAAQLLAELDGVDSLNEGVFVLGATNHPWDVDAALLRPGRFDRSLLVLPPDELARQAILGLHLRDRPTDDLDLAWVAKKTNGFSGADLAHLCESAAELAIEESLTQGVARPITMNDLKQALGDLRPSTRGWFEVARNYAMFANESGTYDELLTYMRSQKLL